MQFCIHINTNTEKLQEGGRMEPLNNYMVMPWYDHGMTDDEVVEYYKKISEKEDMLWEDKE